jgi:tRNA threonylcarbamoyladenosine biosynthesis protein TsaB
MPNGPVLAIDASTYAGSAAVVQGGAVLAERTTAMRGEREERLMPAVAEVLEAAGVAARDLAGIVCGGGPGSFTSLRIAASIAKGLAVAAERPLYAVPSPVLIVASAALGDGSQAPIPPGRYLAVLDAMRGDLFAQGVELTGERRVVVRGDVMLVPRREVAVAAAELHAQWIGPAVGKGDEDRPPLCWAPHARGAALLDLETPPLRRVDVAAWEPLYGRLAEAQVTWERTHGRPLPTGSGA